MKFIVGLISIIALAGCSANESQSKLETLKADVVALQQQLEESNQEVAFLKEELATLTDKFDQRQALLESFSSQAKKGIAPLPVIGQQSGLIKVPANSAQVQTALQTAGYYNGPIDGKVGKLTKKAINDFQQDHNLKKDGIVGKQTWAELELYLE